MREHGTRGTRVWEEKTQSFSFFFLGGGARGGGGEGGVNVEREAREGRKG